MQFVLRKLQRDQRGNAMVESALVLLVLLMTTIFVIDFGRMLLMQEFITERAQQTARKRWSTTGRRRR